MSIFVESLEERGARRGRREAMREAKIETQKAVERAVAETRRAIFEALLINGKSINEIAEVTNTEPSIVQRALAWRG